MVGTVLGGIPASWIAGDIGCCVARSWLPACFMKALRMLWTVVWISELCIQGPILILEMVTSNRPWLARQIMGLYRHLGQPVSKW